MAPPTRSKRKRQEEEDEHKQEEEEHDSSEFSEDDEDDEEEDDDEEEILEKKELPQRSTRGRRTKQLMEDEADEEFWNQDAWKELDDQDDEIKSEEFSSDAFGDSSDSDIDLDENEELKQEEEEAAQQARDLKGPRRGKRQEEDYGDKPSKKKSRYVDPALNLKPKTKREPSAVLNEGPLKQRRPRLPVAPRSIELRASTKSLSRASRQVAISTEAKKTKAKPHTGDGEQQPKPVIRLTHREMLQAAAATAFENRRALEAMLVLQEEQKKRHEAEEQDESEGPRILFQSTISGDKIAYSDPSLFPKQKLIPPYPQPTLCDVTKAPAKYRVPQTLVPFANSEAYKVLKGM